MTSGIRFFRQYMTRLARALAAASADLANLVGKVVQRLREGRAQTMGKIRVSSLASTQSRRGRGAPSADLPHQDFFTRATRIVRSTGS